MTSPYGLVGEKLVQRGYSAIPIVPGEKRPGDFKRGEWIGAFNWERFCDRLPTHFEYGLWSTWPDAGVCVTLGRASNLIAIDFDYGSDEVRATLEALLPPSPVRKTGAKGYTAFYRFSGIASRKFQVGGVSVIEVLSHGKQTVLPPTIHPEGMPYKWITQETLESTLAKELPQLPDDLIQRIEKALAPFQTVEDQPAYERSFDQQGANPYWRGINDRAMADFGAWVPELFPMAKPDRQGNWRVIAHWRNCEKPNVSIHREGITDWGAGENMTPIDLVLRSTSADFETAVAWLRDRVGAEPLDVVIDLDAMRAAAERRSAEAKAELHAQVSARDNAPPPQQSPPPPPPPPPGAVSLFSASGAVGAMIGYINSTSLRPQPVLAVGAVLCALGALMGRRYRSPTNLRSNLYAIGIADSGAGKNWPRVIINRVFAAAEQQAFLGGNKIASGSGLVTATLRHPSLLFLQDEFGHFLSAAADRKRSPHHITEILDLMTEFYTTSNDIWRGAEYSDQRLRPRRDIINPNVCIYGTTNPHSFWNALQSSNAVDGSLARFLIFVTEENYPGAQDVDSNAAPPDDLVEIIRRIATHGAGNLSGVVAGDIAPPPPMEVPYTTEVIPAVRAFEDEIINTLRSAEGTHYTAVIARQFEMTIKVALIHAVGCNPENPWITPLDFEWAKIVVQRSIDTMISGIDRYVADNQNEAHTKRTLEIIRGYGADGVSKSILTQRTQFLNARDRDQVLKTLIDAEQITSKIHTTGRTKPLTTYHAIAT